MSKVVVVVSTYVDNIIKEQQPDVKFILFNSLQELGNHIETTPIRANNLYLTKEVLEPRVNTSLDYLISMLNNPFFVVDKVEYITDKGSSEIHSVKYIIGEMNLSTWRISEGRMTREYVSGLITGTLRSEDVIPNRKAVYRQRRSEYVAERMKDKKSLDAKYVSDEEDLTDVPDEKIIDITPMAIDKVCKTITIAGLDIQERTAFSFLMAQYLSHSGKTLIIEKDFEYLTLSDMITKAKISYARVDIKELYANPSEVFRFIRNTREGLITLTCHERSEYDYSFLCNLVYNNLADTLDYLVVESALHEVSTSVDYITVLPNNIVDVIKTTESLPDNFKEQATFVGVNMRTLPELGINNTKVMTEIVKDLLQVAQGITVPIINIRSLMLGGEAHDLRMLIRGQ